MTAIDQFDPFQRRITEAIDEIAAARMPDYLDDALRLTARTSQRRRPALWRLPSMNRLTYAAAAAVIIAALAGGALLFRPASNTGGPPTASPTQSSTPSLTPALAPESLRSTWIAEAGPAASPGSPSSLARIVISAAGDRLAVLESGSETFVSRPVAGPGDELDIAATDAAGGCTVGDLGRYRYALGTDGTVPGSDGTHLNLTLVADSCAPRSAILARGWVHAIDARSNGGRGVSAAFTPMFLVTMPAASYDAEVGPDSLTLTSATLDRTLIALKNPVGWTEPCSATGGVKQPIEPTIAAFTAYLATMPGFTVQSSNLTIDGHPAALLTIPSIQTADCPSHRVNEWTSSDPGDIGGWHLNQGETDVVYLVEVEGNLILLQWLGGGVTTAEEQALLATVHFTDTLPQ